MSASTVLGAACEAGERALIGLTPDEPGAGPCDAYLAATAEMRGLRVFTALCRRYPATAVADTLERLAAELRDGRRP